MSLIFMQLHIRINRPNRAGAGRRGAAAEPASQESA